RPPAQFVQGESRRARLALAERAAQEEAAEVRGDFIWMGPYAPQSFYATGSQPSRYLYYKDVHRDVEL
ncbi:MAG: hypothetical protein ACRENJ_03360, partial [Candidatus Eiseniibacteriota bacterium]